MTTKKSRAAGAAIQAYLDRHNLSQQDFASRLGKSQSLISQWINGTTRLNEETGAKIIIATDGELTAEDLFPKLFLGRRAA